MFLVNTYVSLDKLGTAEAIGGDCDLEVVFLLTDERRMCLGVNEPFVSADCVLESGAER